MAQPCFTPSSCTVVPKTADTLQDSLGNRCAQTPRDRQNANGTLTGTTRPRSEMESKSQEVKVKKNASALMAVFRQAQDKKADIIMSIKPEHMDNIARGVKNHEYRKYLLPRSIKRIWFYTSLPESCIRYVAQVSAGREPGEVPEDGGLGNDDFNAGKKVSKYGYAIEKLWELDSPIPLSMGRNRGYLKAPPQKYNYAPKQLITDFPLQSLEVLIDRVQTMGAKNKRPLKVVSLSSSRKKRCIAGDGYVASDDLETNQNPKLARTDGQGVAETCLGRLRGYH